MTSSLLLLMIMSCSMAGARAEESSVRLRVRFTHSSWMLSFASVAGIYDGVTDPGTTRRADNVCSCAGDEEAVVIVIACGDVKNGGGSWAPSPTAANPSVNVRLSGRSCSHGVGERERERLRIVRNEGRYISMMVRVE